MGTGPATKRIWLAPKVREPAPKVPERTGSSAKRKFSRTLIRPPQLAVAFALGGAAGASAVHATSGARERVVYVDRGHRLRDVAAEPRAPPRTTARKARSLRREPRAPSRGGQLCEERALLDVARTALGRGDGEATLATLAKHERRFPSGQLTEEREALAVQARVRREPFRLGDDLRGLWRS